MPELRALIFDVDGTLADTEREGHWLAFNRAFAELGLDWYWSDALYRELLAVPGGRERLRAYVQQYHPEGVPAGELEAFVSHLHAVKSRHYQRLLAEGSIPLRPGVRRVLAAARAAGLRRAVASTSALPNVIALLEHTLGPGYTGWFEVIAAGEVVARKKPAPDVYVYALQALGLSPEECLAFEDSQAGLQAALGAGLRTVVTFNEYTRDQDFTGAVLVANHLGEPDTPWTVLVGAVGDAPCFDLSLARRLLQE